MKMAQKDKSPRVFIIASRESPSAGNATYSAFSMRCQNGVAIRPSNVTVDSMTITNTIRDWLMFSVSSNPTPGGRNIHLRRDFAARQQRSQSNASPRFVTTVSPYAAQTACSTQISVGPNFERMLNARANGSAWVSHVLRPKKNIPVQVRTENPMANHASWEGMDRPSQTSSSQANTRNK